MVIAVAVLYFARVVFIPLALAVLFAFLLAPLVIRLRRWGLGRGPSVVIVVLLSFMVLAIFGAWMASQLTDVARKLPEYEQTVRAKMDSIRTSGSGLIDRATRVIHNLTDELIPAPAVPARNAPGEEKPVQVEIRKTQFAPLEMAQKVLGSVLDAGVVALIVVVFVVFILIQREDLRNRLIRLVGDGQVNVATQALDDAAQRLSRYLLAQLVINVSFGALAGIGLYLVGVPNPFLWGLVAALLRYIPYLGIWIAAALPAAMVFAVDPGWVKVPMIFGLYFGIDLLMYNFVEPLLYGSSTGISPVGILAAAVFWTWLWGPLGLLLATPLTVCVVVLGRYVPNLEFLEILLSDEPVLKPEIRFYQRMLAMDLEEATGVAEEFLKGKSLEELDDVVIIPALSLAEEDRHRGKLDDERQQFIFENTRMLVEDLGERSDELAAGNNSKNREENKDVQAAAKVSLDPEPSVYCIPARDEADEIAALMLAQLLAKRGVNAKALSCTALAGECLAQVEKGQAKIACIALVPPFGYMHARYICRRLRAQFPDLRLIVAVLTERDVEEVKRRLPSISADEVTSSLKQALTAILSFLPTTRERDAQPALSSP